MSSSPSAPAFAVTDGPLPVLRWPAVAAAGVEAVVTTRQGGVSTGPYRSLNLGLHVGDDPVAVAENRRRAAEAVGAGADDLVFANQVHGRSVAVVGAAERGRGLERLDDGLDGVDALVTAEPGVTLVILVADCTPLVLVDPVARVLAVVHAGWRGTTARVAEAALGTMASLGAEPRRVVAAIGPAIGPDRYQVGPEVAEAVDRAFTQPDGLLRADGPGHWTFDLWAANHRTLVEAGVPPAQIHLAPVATGGEGPFFSDRDQRPCGRFGILARIRP